ncbi:recombination regulator RecX [Candidatus Thioglobus sp.]|jgi:regulatory protein|nr:recombination regulator RecX [Candidatus Thioglobus sp.]MDB4037781.1 recombination regulator RecX [Candidatus Thioglobus sp.]MDB9938054.1 recombination regulator RecX [Candidatus Thioglobus sp.]MDC1449403.1 recombination regulator RecX [Candidatus Thioglobus sp.]
MTKQSQQSKCYAAALKMLMRREHSKLELRQKLNLKDFDDAVINDSISLLAEQKYQSDERFSEAFILMRFNQGKGPIKISMELKSRGITEFDLTLFNWFELAKDVKYKKFGDSKFLDYKEKSKQKRFLQSRGFGFDEINQAFQ